MATTIDKHCQEANQFIKELASQLGTPGDTEHALRVLRCVFKALRRRIVPEESMHIISQLPLIFKGMYVDGWNIHDELSDAQTFNDFLDEIRNNTESRADVDFADDELAKKKITTVFKALKVYISEGELDHIRAELPNEIAGMIV